MPFTAAQPTTPPVTPTVTPSPIGDQALKTGIYALLKRRCRVIIAVDAEADPTMSFGSFLTLERYARIDLGVTIDLPWHAIKARTLEVDKIFAKGGGDKLTASGPHCAAGEIDFGDGTSGVLLYVKASLTGDENDYVLDYKGRNPDFPHETTGDQFFGEEQFEVYRALGFHMMRMVLMGQSPFAVKPRPGESVVQARQRILDRIHAAIRGIIPAAIGGNAGAPSGARAAAPTDG